MPEPAPQHCNLTRAPLELHPRAVIYARVSSEAQVRKGAGIQSQITRCEEYARMKRYTVIETFTDKAMSGGMIDRPGVQDMLVYLKKHSRLQTTIVIIDDISRLARDIRAHLELREAIAAAGGKLESPSVEFGEDSDSLLVENLLATVSQHQRQKGAEQTRNRMRARLLDGYWPFHACIGFKFEKVDGRGKVLMRNEPIATIIQEGLEGYASGRFQLQAEVKRFFESQPGFPKTPKGHVRNQIVKDILTRPLYAGMVERPQWGINLRKGQHEGLISFETFQKIQTRLEESAKAPARADISEDFPLRGHVDCAECSHAMTSCWSTSKSGVKHPYYMCFKKGCAVYRKSIRRNKIEGDFQTLLTGLQPGKELIRLAFEMFSNLWQHRLNQSDSHRREARKQLGNLQKQIDHLLDRITKANSVSVISAYEKRIDAIDREKLLLTEKLEKPLPGRRKFEELFEHAVDFLSNPQKLWNTGQLQHQKTVLKLAFAQRLSYSREHGFSNTELSLPFKLLGEIPLSKKKLAEEEGFEPPGP